MTVADKIKALLQRKQHRLNLTAEDIAEMIYGEKGAQQDVNTVCLQLVEAKELERLGKGGQNDPFCYRIYVTPIERRKIWA
jgi:hypothetical protein